MRRRRRPGPLAAEAMAGRLLSVTIEELGARGDGIARDDGELIFVPYTLPGERVIVQHQGRRGDGSHARLVDIVQSAADRVTAPCRHFGTCGGCALQHLEPAAQAGWKRAILVQAMARAGIMADRIAPMISIPPGSRRRATFAYRRHGNRLQLGFNARASHLIVDLSVCPLLAPALVLLLPQLRDYLRTTVDDGATGDVTATVTASGIDLLIDGDCRLDLFDRQQAAAFADQADLARLTWRVGGTLEPLSCRRRPQVVFGGVAVEPPPGGFLQPSADGEQVLTRLVLDGVGTAASVADLYAGCGSFSFALARHRAVHAVEGDPSAARALKDAAARGGARITVEERDLARRPLVGRELAPYRAVVFDPPRNGAVAQAQALADEGPSRVVAVSCNPTTLARDIGILIRGGYDMVQLTPVDQFPWAAHLEAVALLVRRGSS